MHHDTWNQMVSQDWPELYACLVKTHKCSSALRSAKIFLFYYLSLKQKMRQRKGKQKWPRESIDEEAKREANLSVRGVLMFPLKEKKRQMKVVPQFKSNREEIIVNSCIRDFNSIRKSLRKSCAVRQWEWWHHIVSKFRMMKDKKTVTGKRKGNNTAAKSQRWLTLKKSWGVHETKSFWLCSVQEGSVSVIPHTRCI